MSEANFQVATQAIADWRNKLYSGEPQKIYRVGDGRLGEIELAPGRITLLGGAPAVGKTALAMQFVVDALRLSPMLRVVCCNVEMGAESLLERQVSRLSGVPLRSLQTRQVAAAHTGRIDMGICTLQSVADRLCFVRAPYDLDNIARTVDSFVSSNDSGEMLVVLDYIQRILPPGTHKDKRLSIDASMNMLRQFADAGAAVLVIAAVGRQRDNIGRSGYQADSLNLASFKESGELEYGADDAYILAPHGQNADLRHLKHLKSRHSRCSDIFLNFNGALQSFTAIELSPAPTSTIPLHRRVQIWQP